MKSTIGIKNFRSFDSEGCSISLNPISILTGTNSSGKSSFVKGILALNGFLEQFNANGIIENCFLDLSKKEYQLGTYSNVLNKKASLGDPITISYTTHSELVNHDELEVSISFKPANADDFRIAWFDSFSISLKKEVLITASIKRFTDFYSGHTSDRLEWVLNSKVLRELCLKRIREIKEEPGYNEWLGDEVSISLFKNQPFLELLSDRVIMDSILKSDSFFVLPIMEHIGNLNPDQLDSYASNRSDYKDWKPVLESFRESGITRFYDFFHSLEVFHFRQVLPINPDSLKLNPTTLSYLHSALSLDSYCSRCYSLVDREILIKEFSTDNAIPYILDLVLERSKFGIIGGLPSYNVFREFVHSLVKESLNPSFSGAIHYVPSDKVAIKRLYSYEEESDSFQKLLVSYLRTKTLYNKSKKVYYPNPSIVRPFLPGVFIDKWLKLFEIGSHLSIENPVDGIGIILRLYKSDEDKTGTLLADEGYGISQLIALIITSEICIMKGYSFSEFGRRLSLIVEEPEIHLHPRLQSVLADLFWELLFTYRIHAIVETHSEYMVRKLQVLCAKFAEEKGLDEDHMKSESPVSVFYFERDNGAYDLEMQHNGKFKNEFGPGFFDEAANLAFEIL